MREMIYRNLNSPDRRQKDLTLAEIREEQGITTQLEKRYTYSVKTIDRSAVPSDVVPLQDIPNVWELSSNPAKSRQIFVRKHRNAVSGVEEFTYKIVGSFYAVQDHHSYLIVYRHILHLAVSNQAV